MRTLCVLLTATVLSLGAGANAEEQAPIQLRLVTDAGGAELPTRDGGKVRLGPPLLPAPLEVTSVASAGAEVRVTLGPTSARAVAELTRRVVGQKLAIVVAGVVQSVPLVRSPIVDGKLAITLHSPNEAAALAHTLERQ